MPLAQPSHASIPLPELYVPAWQSRHSLSAVARQPSPWYRPGRQVWQAWHSTPRTPVWYVPASHASHEDLPAALTYVPAVQLPQTPSATPLHPLLQICPLKHAAQSTQAVYPLPAWYLPVAHLAQLLAWVFGWYCPGAHSRQVLPYSPVWYLPVSHSLQSSDPMVSAYSPGKHWTHLSPAE